MKTIQKLLFILGSYVTWVVYYFGMSPTTSGSTANSMSERKDSGILYENVSCIVLMQVESTLSKYDNISLQL